MYSTNICGVNNCNAKRKTRSWCHKHYQRWLRSGDPEGVRKFRTGLETCKIDTCKKIIPRSEGGLGLCNMHYQRQYHGRDMYAPARVVIDRSKICDVDGCDRNIFNGRGLCQLHYSRLLRLGKTELDDKFIRIKHPLYGVWKSMRERCNDKHSEGYHNYGGRGIRVCERWNNLEDGFQNFILDMGDRPEGHSIDRIDNNGNYSPENCRWATQVQQSNNTRANVILDLDGISRTATEWAEISGVYPDVILWRFRKGWDVKKAIYKPTGKRKNARDKFLSIGRVDFDSF